MKKSLPLFLCFVIVMATTVSCSKDNPTPPSPTDIMIGHWEIETFTQTNYGATTGEIPYDPYGCGEKDFIDLKTAGVFQVGGVDKDCVLTKTDGTWSLSYGVLQFNGSVQYKIISVSATKLILQFDITSDGGQYYTYTLLKK